MADEEPKGFVIRDRRGRGEEAAPRADSSPSAAPGPTGGPVGEPPHEHGAEGAMPVTFATFAFSLGTSALMLMGEQLDPHQQKVPINLAQAKEIIDILSMLEEKTRGNLNAEEQHVLTDMLYALRMKYVDVASGKQASPSS
jgi:hypothetical protein